jgi:xylan 1,4-beta-xylosidase
MVVGERCFEGTRTFSTQGIDKAILKLFRAYAKMGHQAIAFSSSGSQDPLTYSDKWGLEANADVAGFATLSGSSGLQVLIYNHHDDFDRQERCDITLNISRLPFESERFTVQHYRIDAEHSNAYSEWLRQGKPMYPSPGQYAALKARDGLELLEPPRQVQANDGTLSLHFDMPTHAISLLLIEEVHSL